MPVDPRDAPRMGPGTVRLIRTMSHVYGAGNATIGRLLGLPRTTVRDIVLGKTWKDV